VSARDLFASSRGRPRRATPTGAELLHLVSARDLFASSRGRPRREGVKHIFLHMAVDVDIELHLVYGLPMTKYEHLIRFPKGVVPTLQHLAELENRRRNNVAPVNGMDVARSLLLFVLGFTEPNGIDVRLLMTETGALKSLR
jgi:hypothetical protein